MLLADPTTFSPWSLSPIVLSWTFDIFTGEWTFLTAPKPHPSPALLLSADNDQDDTWAGPDSQLNPSIPFSALKTELNFPSHLKVLKALWRAGRKLPANSFFYYFITQLLIFFFTRLGNGLLNMKTQISPLTSEYLTATCACVHSTRAWHKTLPRLWEAIQVHPLKKRPNEGALLMATPEFPQHKHFPASRQLRQCCRQPQKIPDL